MVLVLALLLVLILFGAGFAVHLLWIAAVIFAIVWIVGFALGRGTASIGGSSWRAASGEQRTVREAAAIRLGTTARLAGGR